jgi:hypothetical protein
MSGARTDDDARKSTQGAVAPPKRCGIGPDKIKTYLLGLRLVHGDLGLELLGLGRSALQTGVSLRAVL